MSEKTKTAALDQISRSCGAVSLMFQIYSYDIGESIRIHNLQERMSELMLPGAELDFRRRSSRLYARISFRMKLM